MKRIIFFCVILLSLVITANAAEGDYIITYRSDLNIVRAFSDSGDEIALGLNMYLVPAEKALALQAAGCLEACEPDIEMTYYDAPNDPYYKSQWNLPLINVTYPWSLSYFGNDVVVGIIDSGLALNHPDIDYSRVLDGYNFGALQTDSDYETNRFDTTDVSGHGTYCAGVIAAKRNNGIGMAGISDNVKILPLKVEGKSGGISMSSVVYAINAGVAAGCDVINISLGAGTNYVQLETAVSNACANGVIIVCAAGNDTVSDPGDHIRYPAGCEDAISVASTTKSNTRAESSVVNESIFISAPANGIISTTLAGSYASVGGTSFAAPQVTAAAAIAKQIYPNITPAQFKAALQFSAKDLNPSVEGRDTEFGYGLLNLADMTRYVTSLKNKSFYVSSFDQGSKSVAICNLTGSDFAATSIFTAYQNNWMNYHDCIPLTLKPGESYRHYFTAEKDHTELSHFLWKSLKSASPVENYVPQRLIKGSASN